MRYFIISIIVATLFLLACRKQDNFITDASAKLEFSLDTLRFDTVFTELGSATRILKVYNKHNQPIKISKISVQNDASAVFHFNVDGVSGNEAKDIEIAANDSLYIFGEVTINPDAPLSASPFVINANLLFETNGNQQNVVLEAWGQNANYIPNRFNQGGFGYLSCNLGEFTWDDPRPYVIYGVLLIDSCTLNIPAGTQIYVHGGLAFTSDTTLYNDGIIYVLPNGKLHVMGTKEKPVVIQGDRIENDADIDFSKVYGQWAGIRLGVGSTNNKIEWATIKNSIVGVRVDSAANVTIKNTQIYNTSSSGLVGIHSSITAENCLIYNNGQNCLQTEYGGNYNMNYCTFASFGNDASALRLGNAICLDPSDLNCVEYVKYRINARFKNCIIYGSQADEIDLFNRTGQDVDFDYQLQNCVVRVKELINPNQYPNFFDKCVSCINANSTLKLFKDPNMSDYHLDTLSVAEQMAIPLPAIPIDLEGNNRDVEKPDIGCYEYQY